MNSLGYSAHTWNKKFPIGSLWIDSDAVDYDLLCFAYFVLILENIDDGLIKVLHANGLVFDYPEIYIRSFWILA